jgi:8-oxo-dGTP diphosphatase
MPALRAGFQKGLMMEFLNQITCKALIAKRKSILLIEIDDQGKEAYILPGGRQEWGESHYETIKRECLEELGAEINKIGEIKILAEKYYTNEKGQDQHLLYVVYECEINEDGIGFGIKKDEKQVGFKWIEVHKMKNIQFYPEGMKETVIRYLNDSDSKMKYLGIIR